MAFFPASQSLRLIMGFLVLVYMGWLGLSIAIEVQPSSWSYSNDQVFGAVVSNSSMMGPQTTLLGIALAACLYADWSRARAARLSAIAATGCSLLAWCAGVMPQVSNALESSGTWQTVICGTYGNPYSMLCSSLTASGAMPCVVVVFQLLLLVHAVNAHISLKAHHDVINFEQFREPADGRLTYLLYLGVAGQFVWTVSNVVLIAGSEAEPLNQYSAADFATHFTVLATLIPLVQTSPIVAVISFWVACLASAYGWATLVFYAKGQSDINSSLYCPTQYWFCQTQAASTAGMGIALVAETLLAVVLGVCYLYQQPLAQAGAGPLLAHYGAGPEREQLEGEEGGGHHFNNATG